MRTAFIQQLIKEATTNDRIFLLVGDLGFSVVEPFAEQFPDRFLNVGIAEQNMAGIAAGLATEGYCVFIYSIGNFPTLRCMEQIRYDICYPNLNVKIVAVGGGYAYGPLGASHHATEEIGMLRTLPNMTVCSPADPVETELVTHAAILAETPFYLRLGKAGEARIHHGENKVSCDIGDFICLRKEGKTAVLATGSILKYAVDFIDQYQIDAGLYSFPYVKPINLDKFAPMACLYDRIITIEEHQKSAGFGSAILEALSDSVERGILQRMPRVKRIAIPDQFYSISGSQHYLRELAGLNLKQEYF